MTRENQIELVKEVVTNYFIQHADHTGVSDLGRSERAHIIEIGASILCTKWEVGYEGGGFVQAFVANDLMTHFKDDILKSIIPRNVKLSECTSFGKPIILYDITSKGSEAYLSLARELILKSEKRLEPSQVKLPLNQIPKFEDYQVES